VGADKGWRERRGARQQNVLRTARIGLKLILHHRYEKSLGIFEQQLQISSMIIYEVLEYSIRFNPLVMCTTPE